MINPVGAVPVDDGAVVSMVIDTLVDGVPSLPDVSTALTFTVHVPSYGVA